VVLITVIVLFIPVFSFGPMIDRRQVEKQLNHTYEDLQAYDLPDPKVRAIDNTYQDGMKHIARSRHRYISKHLETEEARNCLKILKKTLKEVRKHGNH